MADGHGGPRTPSAPAPASGPGRLSKRTDGGPGQKLRVASGGAYGDRQGLLDQEKTAAMSQSPAAPTAQIPSTPAGPGGSAPAQMPFDAPTQRPDEPITSGVPTGPGPGPMVGPSPQPDGYLTNMLRQMSATDTTGTLGKLYIIAQQRGV